jgi:hypothetical protein
MLVRQAWLVLVDVEAVFGERAADACSIKGFDSGPDADRAVSEDVGAEAAAVDQAPQNTVGGQALEV